MLKYKQYGDLDAPLIIFLHGGGVSSWMWDEQIQYFTHYHCVTIDLPEQGMNKDKGKFSIEYGAQKVIEVIEHIKGDKQVSVIGFSLGAQVLIKMLSMTPDLIDYAMINSALVRPNKIGAKALPPLIKLTYPLTKNKTFSKLQAKTLYIDDGDFDLYYNESSKISEGTLVRILQENMSFKIPQAFKDACGKILVTVGQNEIAMMKKSAFDLVNANENCTGLIISEIGHGAPLANPTLFNQIVDEWLGQELNNR